MVTISTTAQNPLVRALYRSGLLAEDLDYHVVRASMVIVFFSSVTRNGFHTSSNDWSHSSATGR